MPVKTYDKKSACNDDFLVYNQMNYCYNRIGTWFSDDAGSRHTSRRIPAAAAVLSVIFFVAGETEF